MKTDQCVAPLAEHVQGHLGFHPKHHTKEEKKLEDARTQEDVILYCFKCYKVIV